MSKAIILLFCKPSIIKDIVKKESRIEFICNMDNLYKLNASNAIKNVLIHKTKRKTTKVANIAQLILWMNNIPAFAD